MAASSKYEKTPNNWHNVGNPYLIHVTDTCDTFKLTTTNKTQKTKTQDYDITCYVDYTTTMYVLYDMMHQYTL